MMTDKELTRALITVKFPDDIFPHKLDDIEAVHEGMDKVLIDFLRSIGYNEAANYFESTERWYA